MRSVHVYICVYACKVVFILSKQCCLLTLLTLVRISFMHTITLKTKSTHNDNNEHNEKLMKNLKDCLSDYKVLQLWLDYYTRVFFLYGINIT